MTYKWDKEVAGVSTIDGIDGALKSYVLSKRDGTGGRRFQAARNDG